MTAPLRVLTWHVHGSYLAYLARTPHQFFLPVDHARSVGYGGRAGLPLGSNVHEVPAGEVRHGDYDLILYQSQRNWEVDRTAILSEAQRNGLPQAYLEHDPPRATPTQTRHPVDDRRVLIVHCTHFNRLMWDCGDNETIVIDHGVPDPGHLYTGELDRGLVVVNGLRTRGRRLGADIFERMRRHVPLDLVGMGSEDLGGLGEVPMNELPAFAARYRFFFHPIRYTSLGLALLEAMTIGLPVVGLATTELPTVIRNGANGFIDTDETRLREAMQRLLDDPQLAREIGLEARRTALGRFGIERFAEDWSQLLRDLVSRHRREAA